MPRARIILEHGEARAFDTFDRFAQLAISEGRTLASLLDELAALRQENLRERRSAADGRGPRPPRAAPRPRRRDAGQRLATWVAHDLDHVVQVSRVLARQYSDEVGPWRAYLRIISGTQG